MTMAIDGQMTMGTRWRQLMFWSAFTLVALAAFGAGGYAWLHRDAFAPPAATAASEAPSQVGHMKLAAQFAGPLKDTVVQRWEDPATGNTCYIYLPVVVQHSPPTPTGFVQYGANGIGSISCLK
jgi:hypothetical protein